MGVFPDAISYVRQMSKPFDHSAVNEYASPAGQARVLVYRYISSKSITAQLIKPLEKMLKEANLTNVQFNQVVNDLDATIRGNSLKGGKLIDRISLLSQKLSEAIKRATVHPVSLQTGPEVFGFGSYFPWFVLQRLHANEHGGGIPNLGATGSGHPANRGGVDMNSRFLDLKEYTDGSNVSVIDDKALIVLNGVVPRLRQLVTVTPGMLKVLLGQGPA
jgi:hypothetical protein